MSHHEYIKWKRQTSSGAAENEQKARFVRCVSHLLASYCTIHEHSTGKQNDLPAGTYAVLNTPLGPTLPGLVIRLDPCESECNNVKRSIDYRQPCPQLSGRIETPESAEAYHEGNHDRYHKSFNSPTPDPLS